jgi:hypothetical protein
VFAASASKRRLLNHETTKDATKHVDLDLLLKEEAFEWSELPFFNSLEIAYDTLDAVMHKLAMKNSALIGHLHKCRQSRPDMLAKQRPTKQISIFKKLTDDKIPHRDPLPSYDMNLQKEHPWSTLESIQLSYQVLKAVKKNLTPREPATTTRKLKGISESIVNKQLSEELPFYNVDL